MTDTTNPTEEKPELYQLPDPLGTYLIVTQETVGGKKTKGGIVIPDRYEQMDLPCGTILRKSEQCSDRFQEGDIVFYSLIHGIRALIPSYDPTLGALSKWGTIIFLKEEHVVGILRPRKPESEVSE